MTYWWSWAKWITTLNKIPGTFMFTVMYHSVTNSGHFVCIMDGMYEFDLSCLQRPLLLISNAICIPFVQMGKSQLLITPMSSHSESWIGFLPFFPNTTNERWRLFLKLISPLVKILIHFPINILTLSVRMVLLISFIHINVKFISWQCLMHD